jgi:hypothetical protein
MTFICRDCRKPQQISFSAASTLSTNQTRHLLPTCLNCYCCTSLLLMVNCELHLIDFNTSAATYQTPMLLILILCMLYSVSIWGGYIVTVIFASRFHLKRGNFTGNHKSVWFNCYQTCRGHSAACAHGFMPVAETKIKNGPLLMPFYFLLYSYTWTQCYKTFSYIMLCLHSSLGKEPYFIYCDLTKTFKILSFSNFVGMCTWFIILRQSLS